MGKCIVCEQEAVTVRPFEILPNNALAMEAIHENNIKHTWTEHKSQSDLGRKLTQEPKIMTCPMCGEIGRLGSFRKDNMHLEFVTYYIKHKAGSTNKGTHYITDPKQREKLLRQLGRYIEVSSKDKDANPRTVKTALNLISAPTDGQPKIPKNKRLTTCTVCNKPGYKYRTYFQHYNEPPIGKIKLKGKEIGDKYRRCYLPKTKEKNENDNATRKSNLNVEQRASAKSFQDQVSQKLDRYVAESSSSKSLGEDGKDYKKMYFDLVDKLRKIVGVD